MFYPFSDVFSVAYQQTSDEKDLEYAFFGIFDGHGGREAAQYSKVMRDLFTCGIGMQNTNDFPEHNFASKSYY